MNSLVRMAMSFRFLAALILGVFLSVPVTSYADYILPGAVVVRTKAYHPRSTNFPKGSYEYQISWEGIPVGTAMVKVDTKYQDGKRMLDVEASARSASVVRLFYSLNHLSKSIFAADSLAPVEFHSRQIENSRFTNRDVNFLPDGSINAKIMKGKKNTAGDTEELSFRSENSTFDPISAAFLARSLPVDPKEDLSFDVFNGKHRFLISFHVLGRETVKVAGRTYDAFKVEPTVKKLTDTEGEKRIRRVFIWVSADDSREVLKLESEVFLGAVNAKLVKFTPDVSPEPEISRARLNEPEEEKKSE